MDSRSPRFQAIPARQLSRFTYLTRLSTVMDLDDTLRLFQVLQTFLKVLGCVLHLDSQLVLPEGFQVGMCILYHVCLSPSLLILN